jgi:chromosome segregation ATPase
MSRISFDDVCAVADDLMQQGIKPVTLNVYGGLGKKGSYTTIGKHLKAWADQQSESDFQELPSEVILPEKFSEDAMSFTRKVWSLAHSEAMKEIEVERQALEQARQEMQAQVDEASAFAESVQADRDKAIDKSEILEKLLGECKELLTIVSSDKVNADNEVFEIKNKLEEKQERIIKTEALLSKQDHELKSVTAKLAKVVVELSDRDKANAELKDDRTRLTVENKTYISKISELENNIKASLSDVSTLGKEQAALLGKHESLSDLSSLTKSELVVSVQENKVLIARATQAESDCRLADDKTNQVMLKLRKLEDDYKVSSDSATDLLHQCEGLKIENSMLKKEANSE